MEDASCQEEHGRQGSRHDADDLIVHQAIELLSGDWIVRADLSIVYRNDGESLSKVIISSRPGQSLIVESERGGRG